MEVKFFRSMWEDDPNKKGNVIITGKYRSFLKQDGKTIKINKIVHRAGNNIFDDSAYVYYDDIKAEIVVTKTQDRFTDLDLTGDD